MRIAGHLAHVLSGTYTWLTASTKALGEEDSTTAIFLSSSKVQKIKVLFFTIHSCQVAQMIWRGAHMSLDSSLHSPPASHEWTVRKNIHESQGELGSNSLSWSSFAVQLATPNSLVINYHCVFSQHYSMGWAGLNFFLLISLVQFPMATFDSITDWGLGSPGMLGWLDFLHSLSLSPYCSLRVSPFPVSLYMVSLAR